MQISEKLSKNLQKILIDDGVEAISVVDPKKFSQNIENFEKIFASYRLRGAIHHVMKVNHSYKLLQTSQKHNLRADVSSIGELEKALHAGFTAEKITANGPKNKKFLEKSLAIGARIAVDSIEELEKIAKYADIHQKKIPILIRL